MRSRHFLSFCLLLFDGQYNLLTGRLWTVDTPEEIFSIFRSELPKMEIRNDNSWQ